MDNIHGLGDISKWVDQKNSWLGFKRVVGAISKTVVRGIQDLEIAPGFFVWVIPSGNDSCRIDCGQQQTVLTEEVLKNITLTLLNHPLWKERFANIKETARYCGPRSERNGS